MKSFLVIFSLPLIQVGQKWLSVSDKRMCMFWLTTWRIKPAQEKRGHDCVT